MVSIGAAGVAKSVTDRLKLQAIVWRAWPPRPRPPADVSQALGGGRGFSRSAFAARQCAAYRRYSVASWPILHSIGRQVRCCSSHERGRPRHGSRPELQIGHLHQQGPTRCYRLVLHHAVRTGRSAEWTLHPGNALVDHTRVRCADRAWPRQHKGSVIDSRPPYLHGQR